MSKLTIDKYKVYKVLAQDNEKEVFPLIMMDFIEDIIILNEKKNGIKLDYSKNQQITNEILKDYCNDDFKVLVELVEIFLKKITGLEFSSSIS